MLKKDKENSKIKTELREYKDIAEINYSYYWDNGKCDNNILKETKKIKKAFEDLIKNHNQEKANEKTSSKKSNDVLNCIAEHLGKDYKIEKNTKHHIKIKIDEKEFWVDALNKKEGIIIEVESGRGYANHQFLKDILECAMVSSKREVIISEKDETEEKYSEKKVSFESKLFLIIAVRNAYYIKGKPNYNYHLILKWLNALEASGLDLKLKGILLIGY